MARGPRVTIIGGGIGGLAAANALHQQGIEVRVFEAAPELREIGAGVNLPPNSMKVLRGLGLEDAVRTIGWDPEHYAVRHWKTGEPVQRLPNFRTDTTARYGAAGCRIHRADLLDVLAASVSEKVPVSLGDRAVSVETNGDVALARFVSGAEVESDLIVGADGIHSMVRTALFGPDAPRFTGKICYRSVLPVDSPEMIDLRDGGSSFGPHGEITLYGLRRGELLNVVCHHDEDDYKEESWVRECERDEVRARFAHWNTCFHRLFSPDARWYKWAMFDRDPIPQWSKGRITILGDAAHPMLPYHAQGAGQALEDGVVLASAIARMADDPVGALQLYERVRVPRASAISVLSSRSRAADNHVASPFKRWKRDILIKLRTRFTSTVTGRNDAWIYDYDACSPSVLDKAIPEYATA